MADAPSTRTASRSRTGLVTAALVTGVLIAGAVVWFVMRERGAAPAEDAAQAEAPPQPLAARLVLTSGAPGEDAAAVLRVYNAHARLARAAGDRAEGIAPDPVAVTVSAADWSSAVTLETVAPDGTASALPADAVTVVEAPEGALAIGADALAVTLAIRGDAMPPAGTSVRARVDHAPLVVSTPPVDVPVAPATEADRLSTTARAALVLERWDVVLARGEALVAEAPDDPRGYWFRALARDAQGDAAAARADYLATLDRLAPGQEPPVGIYARLRELR